MCTPRLGAVLTHADRIITAYASCRRTVVPHETNGLADVVLFCTSTNTIHTRTRTYADAKCARVCIDLPVLLVRMREYVREACNMICRDRNQGQWRARKTESNVTVMDVTLYPSRSRAHVTHCIIAHHFSSNAHARTHACTHISRYAFSVAVCPNAPGVFIVGGLGTATGRAQYGELMIGFWQQQRTGETVRGIRRSHAIVTHHYLTECIRAHYRGYETAPQHMFETELIVFDVVM